MEERAMSGSDRTGFSLGCAVAGGLALLVAGGSASAEVDSAALAVTAGQIFGPLPSEAANPENPVTDDRVDLGRKLYFDPRLSKNHDISCNSCHQLDRFGVDGEPTSPGHRGQRGGRNSPTVLNAAVHVAQFWDGRSPDVEDQAQGPVLNPIEMALPDAAAVDRVLRSIPGYRPLFVAAFPDEKEPVSFVNAATAIAAFERRLMTPGRLEAFMAGDAAALTPIEQRGLDTFIKTGCITCHIGPAVGGSLYQKLGLQKPYETKDAGRYDVTKLESDRQVFKVPSLRNIAETGPYFHDGSVTSLDEAIRLMGWHQLGVELDAATRADIAAFLGALTAAPDPEFTARPELPASGPDTPAPDPS
jgi:cytochrome c peroxidase